MHTHTFSGNPPTPSLAAEAAAAKKVTHLLVILVDARSHPFDNESVFWLVLLNMLGAWCSFAVAVTVTAAALEFHWLSMDLFSFPYT